jgi:hypothetical protein
MKHAGVKYFPRRHVEVTIDRFVGYPHRHVTAKLPPQPLSDLLRRSIVVELVSDNIPQPNVRGELARFRAPRPLERRRVGGGSGCVGVESVEDAVEDLPAAELAIAGGVLALPLQGGAGLDGGVEEVTSLT